ncbi:MAG: chlorite dismutase family protein [Terriglobales bacterium]
MAVQKEATRRQFVSFTLYKVLPEWRRLSLTEREDQRREFAETIRKWQLTDTIKVLTYSLAGMRAEGDFLLWRICYSLDCLQEMSSDLLRTRLAGYVTIPVSYLGITRHSQYLIGEETGRSDMMSVIKPGGCKYLFVYPMVRARNWYVLPFEQRKAMVGELARLGNEFPRVHLNVTYSFGLDDQEFVVAIETDHPEEFVERVIRIREMEIGPYIQRDTPSFTCIRTSLEDMLERIG